jgi:hypothetical protein
MRSEFLIRVCINAYNTLASTLLKKLLLRKISTGVIAQSDWAMIMSIERAGI